MTQAISVIQSAERANLKDILFNITLSQINDDPYYSSDLEIISNESKNAIYSRMSDEQLSSHINLLQAAGYHHLALLVSSRNRRAADYVRLEPVIFDSLSIAGRWHLAKLRTYNDPSRFQPLNNVEHQFLNITEYKLFDVLANDQIDDSTIVFGPLIGISNAHIDYMLPSIYEKVLKGNVLGVSSPDIKVFVDIDECANSEILNKLSEVGIIQIYPYIESPTMLRSGLAKYPHDYVALANSCRFLNRYGIPNIYSQENGINREMAKEVEGCIRMLLSTYEYCGDPPKKLLCIHNRDSGYKAQEHMSWRDSDPNILAESLDICTGLGLKIVRIGQNGRRLSHLLSVLYDKNSNYHNISDPFILTRTSLFIGTSSGPCHYAQLFSQSVLMTNSTSLLPSNCPSPDSIVGLRKIIKLSGQTRIDKIRNILGDWGNRDLIVHRELSVVEMREDIQNIIHKKHMSLRKLMPYSILEEYPIIHNLNVTERCYNNLSEILG